MSSESAGWSSLGKRIRYAREMQQERVGKRMSRAALGQLLERNQRTIERWEADKTVPSIVQLKKISACTGCRLTWLQTGELPVWKEEGAQTVEEPVRSYAGPRPVYPQEKTVPLLTVRSGHEKLVSVELVIRVHRASKDYDIDLPNGAA